MGWPSTTENAKPLAWDVVENDTGTLVIYLFRQAEGGYYLQYVPDLGSDSELPTLPLTEEWARIWFDVAPMHYVDTSEAFPS